MSRKHLTFALEYSCSEIIADPEKVCSPDCNEISQWWRNVRETLSNSTQPFHAFLAAMACRVVGATMEKYKDLQINGADDDNENTNEGEKNAKDLEKREAENVSPTTLGNRDCSSSQGPTSGWENVSADTCQFSILIGNLEDISILNAVVR